MVKELRSEVGKLQLSFESPAAYQVRVPQKVLEAFDVESIHRVLCNRADVRHARKVKL